MLSKIISDVDAFVWGPVMLVLLVGTGILLTIRCNFLTWRNLPWAIIKTLSKESRTKTEERVMYHHFSIDNSTGGNDRNWKYRRSSDSNGFRRCWSIGVDVDFCMFWIII